MMRPYSLKTGIPSLATSSSLDKDDGLNIFNYIYIGEGVGLCTYFVILTRLNWLS